MWCREDNLLLNTSKTKDVIDFRRKKTDILPPYIDGDSVERVVGVRFLGVHLEEDLTWAVNTLELLKEAQQRLHFLKVLRKNISQRLLVSFYRRSIESILTYCIYIYI